MTHLTGMGVRVQLSTHLSARVVYTTDTLPPCTTWIPLPPCMMEGRIQVAAYAYTNIDDTSQDTGKGVTERGGG